MLANHVSGDLIDLVTDDGIVFFFKQKTAYDVRISDWSSDVCSSDLKVLISPVLRSRPAVFMELPPPAQLTRMRSCPFAARALAKEIGSASGRGRVCPYV